MPLFGRKLVDFNRNDYVNNSDDKFLIKHTGETIQNRNLYEKLMKVYQLERWTCQSTWRAGLTHEEACLSENDIRKTLDQLVPNYFYQTIFEIIYHNVKPLEKLAEEVSIILGQSFVLNEPVQFKKRKDSSIVKGFIEGIEDNDDPKQRTSQRTSLQGKIHKNVQYSIRLIDDNQILDHVLPNELQRCSFIPNREKLKIFIRSYAIRLGNRVDSPWIFYDSTIVDKYQLKSRISEDIIAKFLKSSTITLNDILREQDRLASKQSELNKSNEINNNTTLPNVHSDDLVIVLTDDKELIPNEKPKSKSSVNKKQLTLDEMKFTKQSPNHKELIEKSSTIDIVLPQSLLKKLDKTRRDRGIESKVFQRLILQCARTLTDKQRLRLPDEYRTLIQIKYDELEFKRRLSTMTDDEKKHFLQIKREEQKPIEDLDLIYSKILPQSKELTTNLLLNTNSIGNLLMICTFCTSCQSLFSFALNDQINKTTQIYLRSFPIDYLLNSSTKIFTNYFLEILQIFMKLLFKEDENRSKDDEHSDDDEEGSSSSSTTTTTSEKNDKENDSKDQTKDLENIYSIQLSDIPLTPYTCQELTRLYLLKEKDEINQNILEKLAFYEAKDLSTSEQIDLLLILVNTITTDNELMADYFEYLSRTLSEASRERNQLLAERRKVHEEESKQKKLQLQNGEKDDETNTSKKLPKINSLNSNVIHDENHQLSPIIIDENGEIDHGNDDDLKSVLQRRRQMVAMSKELKEKKEFEAQQFQLKQKRQLALQKAEQIYQEALLNYQCGFRIKPLGYDRYYNRYWFFRGYPGLFVEKGWIGSNITYSSELSPDKTFSSTEKLIPKDELNQWFVYDDENVIQQVFQSLNDRGLREHNLSMNLKKILPFIHQEFENQKKTKTFLEQPDDDDDDDDDDVILSFKTDLEDIETRLRLGSLGGFNQNDWLSQLKQSNQRSDLAELLIQLQQTIVEKNFSEKFNFKCRQIWISDCRSCQTYSRLYVLMIIFENFITWNKSTLGMKCKICRKKFKDEDILVCDQCCYGYHQYCLRNSKDTLKKNVNNRWFCSACQPKTKNKRSHSKISHPNCSICGDENDLIQCTQCQHYYHCQCHEPPLRCPPRSITWTCNQCRNQGKKRKNQLNDDDDEEEEEEEEEDSRIERRSKRLRKCQPSPIKPIERKRRQTRCSMKSISSEEDQNSVDNDNQSDLENDENENNSNDSPSSD